MAGTRRLSTWWRRAARHPSVIGALAAGLIAVGCTAGRGTAPPPPPAASGTHAPVTITLWTYWTGSEKKLFDQGLRQFEAAYPWTTVNHVGGVTDATKVLAAVNGGNPPDLWQWWDSTYVQPTVLPARFRTSAPTPATTSWT